MIILLTELGLLTIYWAYTSVFKDLIVLLWSAKVISHYTLFLEDNKIS